MPVTSIPGKSNLPGHGFYFPIRLYRTFINTSRQLEQSVTMCLSKMLLQKSRQLAAAWFFNSQEAEFAQCWNQHPKSYLPAVRPDRKGFLGAITKTVRLVQIGSQFRQELVINANGSRQPQSFGNLFDIPADFFRRSRALHNR